ncbi:ATP-binding cassette domain-containing protein [Lactobacillus pentosus]|jgi:osmoprotectant transport system ATP-binding protein|uniref:ABC-type quaternary amine transporter n=1 Tax=Lactiplantibacillus pentosus TaxID=1589 RepID=A0AB37RJA2_LACPE|nr:ABC transporter ATP-binding protein [Lactiplantibacillus pentosus]MCH4129887.1 ABC transporter ATP-binding protein [Lactiplantibacillus sp.]BBM23321.1 ABC-type proline/glycine betaine transport system, ATPase component [Lactiplantibacillus plantarum]MCT3294574.1 ATP-binding cassette domain-containing protein [Lactiplantibacillus pentosus]MPQ18525.1 ATP-binding cassette domain-containing protein [Lactiplantibacillus pentosus]RMW41752.1 ABC transporter ATP-binding protein [Lactiplantibacillus
MITFKQVTKTYAQSVALQRVNLTINSRELFVLVGPSGSGKTTLLKMINRLNEPTSGEVRIDDQKVNDVEVQTLRRTIGYVLQSGALFPNMTVFENAAISLAVLGWPIKKQHERVNALLQLVGLAPQKFAERHPSELSGGEAQRVGIVRALAADPLIVLMDEPFSALDPISKRQLQELVLTLHQRLETTFVFVTHDMQEAIKLADRMAVIHNGELQQVGTPAEILTMPKNKFVTNFFAGEVNTKLYLQAVLTAHLGTVSSSETSNDAIELKRTDTLSTWAAILAKKPRALIRVDGKVLAPQDLMQYMATIQLGGQRK